MRVAVRALAAHFEVDTYLEIGVWRGWSLAQVVAERPDVTAVGVDNWRTNFGGVPNPGEDFVISQLMEAARTESSASVKFLSGRSQDVLPDGLNGQTFDLILLDGDRSEGGMAHDLAVVEQVLNPTGVLVFDDLVDSNEGGNRTARQMWDGFREKHPTWTYIEILDSLTPFGVAIKEVPPKSERQSLEAEGILGETKTSEKATKSKKTRRKAS